tara:strand:+ start:3638 stop:5491 length:1854 start_codon:yes stop_codon:yes gene_type:complete
MGVAVSSNFSEMSQEASNEFSTGISQDSKANQTAQNVAQQECKNMKIKSGPGAKVEACNNKVSQSITAEQLNEQIQDANIQNESYTQMQQKMSQAAKSVVKGFNFGAFSSATNSVKQSMSVSTKMSNEISQECNTENAGINKVLQSCDGFEIDASTGGEVYACNMDVQQEILMKQVAKCQQDASASNKSIQKLEQLAKQSASAAAIGIDPMTYFIIGGIIGCVLIIFIGKPIITGISKNAENFFKPEKIMMMAGIAAIGGGGFLAVMSMMMKKDKAKWVPQMHTTGYPGDGKFIRASRFSEDDLANLDKFCNGLNRQQCTGAAGGKGDICEYDFENGCQIKRTFVGYPKKVLGSESNGVSPQSANDACVNDEKCSGWRWDVTAKDKLSGGMDVVEQMKLHSKDVSEAETMLTGAKPGYSRKQCFEKPPMCTKGCPEGTFPDVRDACGIRDGKIVTDKTTCESRGTFTENQGGGKSCSIPGCKWQNETCVNKGGAAKKGWECKTYNCLKCKKDPATGVAILYSLKKGGLPDIEPAIWTKDIWKKYATGVGGESNSVSASESANMKCANFQSYGAVKLPPKGVSKEGNNLTMMAGLGIGGIGLLLLIIGIIRNATAKQS